MPTITGMTTVPRTAKKSDYNACTKGGVVNNNVATLRAMAPEGAPRPTNATLPLLECQELGALLPVKEAVQFTMDGNDNLVYVRPILRY